MQSDDQTNADLAAVLSARICHDLVSPVGAIVNGVDLIREIGASGLDDEFGMISQSAARASGLLQFYRLAFGTAADEGEGMGRDALHARVEAMIATPRILLDWRAGTSGPPFTRPEARLICQLVLCARGIAGMTGTVRVLVGDDGTLPIVVSLIGDGAPDADDRLALLTDPALPASPRSVEFALARTSAAAMGLRIDVDRQPSKTTIAASSG